MLRRNDTCSSSSLLSKSYASKFISYLWASLIVSVFAFYRTSDFPQMLPEVLFRPIVILLAATLNDDDVDDASCEDSLFLCVCVCVCVCV